MKAWIQYPVLTTTATAAATTAKAAAVAMTTITKAGSRRKKGRKKGRREKINYSCLLVPGRILQWDLTLKNEWIYWSNLLLVLGEAMGTTQVGPSSLETSSGMGKGLRCAHHWNSWEWPFCLTPSLSSPSLPFPPSLPPSSHPFFLLFLTPLSPSTPFFYKSPTQQELCLFKNPSDMWFINVTGNYHSEQQASGKSPCPSVQHWPLQCHWPRPCQSITFCFWEQMILLGYVRSDLYSKSIRKSCREGWHQFSVQLGCGTIPLFFWPGKILLRSFLPHYYFVNAWPNPQFSLISGGTQTLILRLKPNAIL